MFRPSHYRLQVKVRSHFIACVAVRLSRRIESDISCSQSPVVLPRDYMDVQAFPLQESMAETAVCCLDQLPSSLNSTRLLSEASSFGNCFSDCKSQLIDELHQHGLRSSKT